jgi:LPXTG-site transpeptidase (sortase) family protein
MRVNLFWRTLPAYFVVLTLFAVPIYQQHLARERAGAAGVALARRVAVVQAKPKQLSGIPVHVVIPRLSVDVAVVPGVYNNSAAAWSVAAKDANYAKNTAPANNYSGRTFIYGHWTTSVFGGTKNIVPGDVAYITTDNNHVFTYIYRSGSVIKPTDTKWLSEMGGKPGLVLMTCQGLWAQDRRLMFFDLEQAT